MAFVYHDQTDALVASLDALTQALMRGHSSGDHDTPDAVLDALARSPQAVDTLDTLHDLLTDVQRQRPDVWDGHS